MLNSFKIHNNVLNVTEPMRFCVTEMTKVRTALARDTVDSIRAFIYMEYTLRSDVVRVRRKSLAAVRPRRWVTHRHHLLR